jgi:hypothetical protein
MIARFDCRSNARLFQIRPAFIAETTSHLINASTGSSSSRGRASQESFQRIARSGPPTCESSGATQTAVQSSNVGDIVAGDAGLGLCFFGLCGAERSVQFRMGEARYLSCHVGLAARENT